MKFTIKNIKFVIKKKESEKNSTRNTKFSIKNMTFSIKKKEFSRRNVEKQLLLTKKQPSYQCVLFALNKK